MIGPVPITADTVTAALLVVAGWAALSALTKLYES